MLSNSFGNLVWFYKKGLPYQIINNFEIKIAENLSLNKSREYIYSRGYARLALSNLFDVKPLEVPIFSVPGAQPVLKDGWGHISISHCRDAIVIAWSPKRIGIDIERRDRQFAYNKICRRFYTSREQIITKHLSEIDKRKFILENWIMKEACYKCQESQLNNDIFEWEWDKSSDRCYQKKLKQKLNFNLTLFREWYVGVASCFLNNNNSLICSN